MDTWSLPCDQGQEARGAACAQTTWWEDGARWTMDLGLDPTWRRALGQERSSEAKLEVVKRKMRELGLFVICSGLSLWTSLCYEER